MPHKKGSQYILQRIFVPNSTEIEFKVPKEIVCNVSRRLLGPTLFVTIFLCHKGMDLEVINFPQGLLKPRRFPAKGYNNTRFGKGLGFIRVF